MFHFRRITLFFLEKRLSEHKMTIFSKNFGGHGPFGPPAAPVLWPPIGNFLRTPLNGYARDDVITTAKFEN